MIQDLLCRQVWAGWCSFCEGVHGGSGPMCSVLVVTPFRRLVWGSFFSGDSLRGGYLAGLLTVREMVSVPDLHFGFPFFLWNFDGGANGFLNESMFFLKLLQTNFLGVQASLLRSRKQKLGQRCGRANKYAYFGFYEQQWFIPRQLLKVQGTFVALRVWHIIWGSGSLPIS